MQNPYKDLIKIIDFILQEIEINPSANRYKIDQDLVPITSVIDGYKDTVQYVVNFKKKKLVGNVDIVERPSTTVDGIPVTRYEIFVIDPNRSALLEERRRLLNLGELPEEETTLHSKTGAGKRKSELTILYLNNNGDLWREPKIKYCYPMGETSDRHKIVRYLATNRGYQQTSQISSALEGKDEQLIRKEIGKIRGNINKFLKLNGKDVIDNKKESGYRIGLNYRIQPKEEVRL